MSEAPGCRFRRRMEALAKWVHHLRKEFFCFDYNFLKGHKDHLYCRFLFAGVGKQL